MPIIFLSFNDEFVEKMNVHFPTYKMNVADYKPDRRTYYVSPANSFGWMNGGIDYPLANNVMPGIDQKLQAFIQQYCYANMHMKHPYLPIGSSIIIDYDNKKSLVSAPTMLYPQNVANTQNAYFASLAVLHNILINRNENLDNIHIIFTSMCCGCGGMNVDDSIKQTLQAFKDYRKYKPTCIKGEITTSTGGTIKADIILKEPNFGEQPRLGGIPIITFDRDDSNK